MKTTVESVNAEASRVHTVAQCDDDWTIEAPIWGGENIEFINALSLMADVINTHRASIIENIYNQEKWAARKLILGYGLVFAEAVANLNEINPHWKTTFKRLDPFPVHCLNLPGYGQLAGYSFFCACYYVTFALLVHQDAFQKLARSANIDRAEGAIVAMALFISEGATEIFGKMNDPEQKRGFDGGLEGFAQKMLLAWFDQWAAIRLKGGKTTNEPRSRRQLAAQRGGARV